MVLLQKELFVAHPLYHLQWVEAWVLDYFTVDSDISSSAYLFVYLSAVSTSDDAASVPPERIMAIQLMVGHKCLVRENTCAPCEGGIRNKHILLTCMHKPAQITRAKSLERLKSSLWILELTCCFITSPPEAKGEIVPFFFHFLYSFCIFISVPPFFVTVLPVIFFFFLPSLLSPLFPHSPSR
jgi:hypothetical protein